MQTSQKVPALPGSSPHEIVRRYFRKHFRKVFDKITRQVRRTPRRLTGPYKTNRQARWKLNPRHPDYCPAAQIPLIEAKLMALLLEFDHAPQVPADMRTAGGKVVGHTVTPGSYRCPVSGRSMSFAELLREVANPSHGRSSFHVGHVRPRARLGDNLPDNTYWTSDLGNRIQGDQSWHDTVKTIIQMAEYHRQRENISWGELVNRYFD